MVKVITYGTFDTFHYGHLELLRRAKDLGDYLIVGLSSDEFNLTKNKTSEFAFDKRHAWISAIRYVDQIIVEHTWDQKASDIAQHQVDILVMGDDWAGKFDDFACKVIYLPRTPHVSSTQLKALL